MAYTDDPPRAAHQTYELNVREATGEASSQP